jgi:uncharacterized membrane protein YhaH (DUF805 family)
MLKQRKFWLWALLFLILEAILAAAVSYFLHFPLLDNFAYSSFLLFALAYFLFLKAMPGQIM